MLKLLCLDPVTYRSTEEELKYISKYLHEDTILLSDAITKGPYTIQCEYDEAMAQPEIIKLCRKAEKEGIDGIFINCFGDPGVRAAREGTNIPVFGGFEPVMMVASGMGDRIGIVTVLDSVLPMISNLIARAGLRDRVTGLKSVGIPVEELTDKEKLIPALTKECICAVKETRAEVIVLGCTAMIDVAEAVRSRLAEEGMDIPVLEAAQTGVKIVEMYAEMKISHSRRTYQNYKKEPEPLS